YNERGAMTAMPHLPALVRDHQDQIRRADLDLAGGVAWYAYDAGGQRVRKRVEKGGVQEERIYVGGYEVWRKRTGSGLQEERQTLHVMDDQRRIALVETLTLTNGAAIANPMPRQRHQLGDHLGTATLEVDELGAVISYEEYHPYGTTSWWAKTSEVEVPAKRYRYTGMERDEETGLAYHGARYLACWLGRWERPDPIGLQGGTNRYGYASNDPVSRRDPTGTRDVEHYNLFRASDAAAIGGIATDAGFPDVPSMYDELEATAVADVGRVQIGDRDIVIGLSEPRVGSTSSSFTQALGIDHAIGAAITYGVEHNPALQFAGTMAALQYDLYSNIPGFTDAATAVTGAVRSEPVQQTLGVLGDAGLLVGVASTIRFGTSRLARGPAGSGMASGVGRATARDYTVTAKQGSPGVTIGTPGDSFLDLARSAEPIPGVYDVAVHSSPTSFWASAAADAPALDLRVVADIVKSRPDYLAGQPIRLLSCDAGAGTLAQQFANRIGAEVTAANQKVWVDLLGTVKTGSSSWWPMGIWTTFKPGVAP
ncbi:MAG: RHS repeat-associated core domain-containing protein, partial [Myxococcota bacterium]